MRACGNDSDNDVYRDLTGSVPNPFENAHPTKLEGTLGVSVRSDGMPGALAVYGFAPSNAGYEPLKFEEIDATRPNASVFVGIPKGSLPLLGGDSFTLHAE